LGGVSDFCCITVWSGEFLCLAIGAVGFLLFLLPFLALYALLSSASGSLDNERVLASSLLFSSVSCVEKFIL
jgi:hypothetical protein